MTSIRNCAASILRLTGISVLVYVTVCVALFVISAILIESGTLMSNGLMKTYQFSYYLNTRRMQINDPACIAFDEDLVYAPKLGSCPLNGPEFNTVLNFDANGRFSGEKSEEIGIAVVGDSVSMGW